MWWGFWNGVGWPATRREVDGHELLRVSLLASGGGIAAGALVGLTRPAPGQVAMANSLAGYGALTAALITVMARPQPDGDHLRDALIAADAGLGAGFLLGRARPVSRSRMALLDGGAALGATAGCAGSLLFMGRGAAGASDTEIRFMAGVTLAGMAAGLIAAWSLTSDWDGAAAPRTSSVPALLGYDEAGWALGAPAPRPVVSTAADGRRGVGAAVDVLGGRF
jgi:hypothetical protein